MAKFQTTDEWWGHGTNPFSAPKAPIERNDTAEAVSLNPRQSIIEATRMDIREWTQLLETHEPLIKTLLLRQGNYERDDIIYAFIIGSRLQHARVLCGMRINYFQTYPSQNETEQVQAETASFLKQLLKLQEHLKNVMKTVWNAAKT